MSSVANGCNPRPGLLLTGWLACWLAGVTVSVADSSPYLENSKLGKKTWQVKRAESPGVELETQLLSSTTGYTRGNFEEESFVWLSSWGEG